MSDPVQTVFLRDVDHGGDPGQPAQVAHTLAAFIAPAAASVDIAMYDFRLSDLLAAPVVAALTEAAARGVAVRIGYDAGKPAGATAATFTALPADPAPVGTAAWVQGHFAGSRVATKPIQAAPQLMHSKCVVRDASGLRLRDGSWRWRRPSGVDRVDELHRRRLDPPGEQHRDRRRPDGRRRLGRRLHPAVDRGRDQRQPPRRYRDGDGRVRHGRLGLRSW